jgi:hypothetical protein
MNTDMVICVCLVIITGALVLLIGAVVFILIEVRRMSKETEKLIARLEEGVNPILGMLNKVSADIAGVTGTVRSQVARVDMTAEHIGQNLLALTETFTKTGYLLHDALAEPLIDLAAFLRGLSRGISFFFVNKKR